MNNLLHSTNTMSSLEIAELTGKQHGHVMRDCRVMFEAIGVVDSKFGFTRLIKGLGDNPDRSVKCYNLDKELTLTLISGYNIEMRYAIIRRLLSLCSIYLVSLIEML